ncbi:F-type H+-transporting ATPase subunit b [Lewinella marina]|uniref:ATP synthase subunit b n=1 Tax=Neolewinella marina TaxID=438751 RepID=A0A2G0CIA8_9BACT|nr:F0F1 ATP synthase subunit B [Neolewinella marina]NJB85161.1 F-type H+-transporting ATPase subunit b [Neolewinella marina]PHK99706.1 ATP synthase F0 subunit B [Neolewinella marina]
MTTLFLADFSVIKPDFGLIFWTVVIFLVLYAILGKLAWKPIQKALRRRDEEIQTSIDEAKRARAEMQAQADENQRLIIEAREERTRIITEAEKQSKEMIAAAKNEAREAAQKVASDARRDIENMRKAAMVDLKKEVGSMAIEIAEKILQKDLKSDANQEAFVRELVRDLN